MELLVNAENIWKIEVTYAVPNPKTRTAASVGLKEGIQNPDAIRIYKVFFGGDSVTVAARPGDPVTNVLEIIYKDAIKGDQQPPDRTSI